MKCPVCGYDAPVYKWMSLKDTPTKDVVNPRINVYTVGGIQNDKIYACPRCGTVHMRKSYEK